MRVFSAFGLTPDVKGGAGGMTWDALISAKEAALASTYGASPAAQTVPVPTAVAGSPLGLSMPVMLGIGAVGLFLLFGRRGG